MAFFQQVEGEAAVIIVKGVYKQCDLYTRDGYFYAKVGGGFIRLMVDGSTSKSDARVEFLSWDKPIAARMGRLCFPEIAGAQLLTDQAATKLLGDGSKADG